MKFLVFSKNFRTLSWVKPLFFWFKAQKCHLKNLQFNLIYFKMNFNDMKVDLKCSQSDYWKICGSDALRNALASFLMVFNIKNSKKVLH